MSGGVLRLINEITTLKPFAMIFSPDMSLRVSIKVNICPYLLAPRDLYLFKQIQRGYSVILYELQAMELDIYPPLLPQRRICSLPFKRNSLHSPYLSSLKGSESDPVKIRLYFELLRERNKIQPTHTGKLILNILVV